MAYLIHNGKSMAKNLLLITIIILSTTIGSAFDDTERVDPLDHLKIYKGGFNVTNIHYWSSASFTGVYGCLIALLWILCGVGYGVYLLATRCIKKGSSTCRKQCYPHYLLLAIFFTVLVILGCGLVLGGNVKFHSQAKKIIDIVIDAADEASTTIYSTARAMKDMDNTLREAGGSPETIEFLTSTSRQLVDRAADIARLVANNKEAVYKGLRIMFIVTTTTFSLTLALAVALLAFGILKFRKTLRGLIAVCWILTVLCWLFFGIFFVLQNVSGDACTAIDGFQQNPYNNTLSSVLPCNDLVVAKSFLNDVSSGIYNLVNAVNKNISSTYSDLFQICNPFSPPPLFEYQPKKCPASAIKIGNVPKLLKMFACVDDEGCVGGLAIAASDYNRVSVYSNAIQTLLDAYPAMDDLVQCQPINDAFSGIVQHCKPLKRSLHMVWGSLVFLSVTMMALVLLWTIDTHHEQDHHSSGGSSVKPNSVVGLEDGDIKKTTNDELQQV